MVDTWRTERPLRAGAGVSLSDLSCQCCLCLDSRATRNTPYPVYSYGLKVLDFLKRGAPPAPGPRAPRPAKEARLHRLASFKARTVLVARKEAHPPQHRSHSQDAKRRHTIRRKHVLLDCCGVRPATSDSPAGVRLRGPAPAFALSSPAHTAPRRACRSRRPCAPASRARNPSSP